MRVSKRILHWSGQLLGAVVLVAAVLVNKNLPETLDAQEPFEVEGTIAQRLSGRDISATVHAVTVAQSIRLHTSRTVLRPTGGKPVRRGTPDRKQRTGTKTVSSTFVVENQADERTTAGRWIVLDVTVESVLTPGVAPQGVTLEIDSDTYASTSRITEGFNGIQLAPGIAQRALLAFEVPEKAAKAKEAKLKLARTRNPWLDSQLVFTLDLSRAARSATVDIAKARFDT